MLNWLGHCIAPTQVLEIDTTLAENELSSQERASLPTNINKLSSAVFCFDNNDLCEETRTGGNTTQCTNGIVIQRMSQSNTSQHEDSSDHGKAQRDH